MPRLMSRLALIGTVLVVALGCSQTAESPAANVPIEALQALIDSVVDDDEAIQGAALAVIAPTLDLEWDGAAGTADPAIGTDMSPDNPVRIASNTKTYVAVAILRLVEDNRLDLNDAIAEHLPASYTEILDDDGYDTQAITVRHLLTHTSGLFDHSAVDRYTEAIMTDPMHRWTRTEQLRGAVDWGDPHGAPGEFYTYCDTGYVLLGGLIEHASGQPMAVAVRELLNFEGLDLASTWWETLEPRPTGVPDRAHQFYAEYDTADFNPSFDLYGGGGIASTVGDLARFYRALFTGGVFADPATADVMLTTVDGVQALPGASERALPPGAYRMGIWVVEVEGLTTYRHTGFFGTLATYVPELDLVVTVTTNQNSDQGALNKLAVEAIRLVAEARE